MTQPPARQTSSPQVKNSPSLRGSSDPVEAVLAVYSFFLTRLTPASPARGSYPLVGNEPPL